MKKKENDLKNFYIKLISIVIAIILIINFTINFILDRIPFIEDISYMNKRQIQLEISEKIREELNSALNKDQILYEDDKKLLFNLYLKIKKEFEILSNQK